MANGDKPTEKEHFIPRMYLRGFSEVKESGKALIWQFNLKTMQQIPVQVCKALSWRALPSLEEQGDSSLNINEYRANKYWSKMLEERFGTTAAASFVIGSEILEDHINEDLEELSHMPKGSHVGQLGISFIADDLPPQFLPRYDYEFLYALRCALHTFAESGYEFSHVSLWGFYRHVQLLTKNSMKSVFAQVLLNEGIAPSILENLFKIGRQSFFGKTITHNILPNV